MPFPIISSLLIVLLCEGIGLLAFARNGKLPSLGFRASAPAPAYILACVFAVIGCWLTISTYPAVRYWAFQPAPLKLLAVAAACIAGTFEEVVFRGYVMNGLDKIGQSKAIQVLVSGLTFGIAHAIWGVPALLSAHGNFTAFLQPVLATTIFGLVAAAIYLIGKRSLGPVILLHVLTDAVIEPGLLISVFYHHR